MRMHRPIAFYLLLKFAPIIFLSAQRVRELYFSVDYLIV